MVSWIIERHDDKRQSTTHVPLNISLLCVSSFSQVTRFEKKYIKKIKKRSRQALPTNLFFLFPLRPKLAEELARDYRVPEDQAAKITATYLKQFRKCPDNQVWSLDAWRTSLWSRALGDNYTHLSQQIYERWLALRYRYLALAPETVTMLLELRQKYLLGLITNGPSNAQWEKVSRLGLGQYFDVVLVSGDLPWEKPQPRIFEEACRYLRVKPESCIMVGDKLETDILGGIEAGLAGTVWVPLGDSRLVDKDGPKPNYTIKQVTDLVKVLNRGPDAHDYEDSNSNASDGM